MRHVIGALGENEVDGSQLVRLLWISHICCWMVQAIAAIKADGSKWVSKYARGGSARKQSARKFYIVIDSIQGHFASNGCGPHILKTLNRNS